MSAYEAGLFDVFASLTDHLHRREGRQYPGPSQVIAEWWGELHAWRHIQVEVHDEGLFEDPSCAPPWWPLEGAIDDLRDMVEAIYQETSVAGEIQAELNDAVHQPRGGCETAGDPPGLKRFWELNICSRAAYLAAWEWPDPEDAPDWLHRKMEAAGTRWDLQSEAGLMDLEGRLDPFEGLRVNPWMEAFFRPM